MASIRRKFGPKKKVIGFKLDEKYTRTKYMEAVYNLCKEQFKVMNSNLKNENPITKDGKISTDALMMESSTSTVLSKPSEDGRKVIEALQRGDGTYLKLCAKPNVPCTCSSRFVPHLGKQGEYEFTEVGEIPFADPKNPDNLAYKCVALVRWFKTLECHCKINRITPLNWRMIGQNTLYQLIEAEQIDKITKEAIRATRLKWFTQFFKDNKRVNEKIQDHIVRASDKIYICFDCQQTSLFGTRKDITLHISNVHHITTRHSHFCLYISNLTLFLHRSEAKRSLLNNVNAVIEAYLDVPLFYKAEQLARSFLRSKNPPNSTRLDSIE